MSDEPAAQSNFIALNSAFSCLVSELSKKGLIDVHDLVQNMQETAAALRQQDSGSVASDLHAISEHLLKSVIDAPPTKRRP